MKSIIHILLIALILVGSLFVVGCNSDDDDDNNGGGSGSIFDPTMENMPDVDYFFTITSVGAVIIVPEKFPFTPEEIVVKVNGEVVNGNLAGDFYFIKYSFEEGKEYSYNVKIKDKNYSAKIKNVYNAKTTGDLNWNTLVSNTAYNLTWSLDGSNENQYISGNVNDEEEKFVKLNVDDRSYNVTKDWLTSEDTEPVEVVLCQYNYKISSRMLFLSMSFSDEGDFLDKDYLNNRVKNIVNLCK